MRALKRTAFSLIFLLILSLFPHMAFGQSEENQAGKGKLEIWFRITSTPMTEREIYAESLYHKKYFL